MARWTKEKNAICFYELKDYLAAGDKEVFSENLRVNYPLLQEHSFSAIDQHLMYLYKLANGEWDTKVKKDKCLYNIFSSITEFDEPENIQAKYLTPLTYETHGDNENSSDTVELNNEHIDSLLSFVGYGDLFNVKIVFFGNEGGLGGKSVYTNLTKICEAYKQETENWFDSKDWRKGYWKQIKWEPGREADVSNSPFLNLSARIVLALEDSEGAIEDWFKPGVKKTNKVVKKFLKDGGLYSNRPGLKTALLDWRPLPRANERDPFPYRNVDEKQYLSAFAFKNLKDNPYAEWVNKRVSVLKNTLNNINIPFLLSFGAIDAKMSLFKQVYPGLEFEKITLTPSGKEIYVSTGKVGENTTIILAKFLSYEHFGYPGAEDLTNFIR